MSPDELIFFSADVIRHLENDRISFESVIATDPLNGKLGFAQIATAMAAFDLYAWLLYQNYDRQLQNSDLFSKLINDSRFFDKSKYGDQQVFYSRIRCGVIHQLFPKEAAIIAVNSSTILYQHSGILCVNAYALYCDVLDGIRKMHQHFETMSEDARLDLSFKLRLRAKMDNEAAQKATIDVASLPVWP